MDLKNQLQMHPHWPLVLEVVHTLRAGGYQAFLVGGAVRDVLLGRPAKDFDLCTDALPEQVEKIFKKTVPIGREFGVIAVVCSSEVTVEVTTFRKELEYNQKRQPTKIEFTDLQGDASRRDFTINALYYDPERDLIVDPFGGQKDLAGKIIRAIGDAHDRLIEDPLRILRAIRFSSRFNFEIDEELKRALHAEKERLTQVARERVFDEFEKMFQPGLWKKALALISEYEFWFPLQLPTPDSGHLTRLLQLDPQAPFHVVLAWLWSEQPDGNIEMALQKLKSPTALKVTVQYFLREGKILLRGAPRLGEALEIVDQAPLGFVQFLEGFAELTQTPQGKLENLLAEFDARKDGQGNLPLPLITGKELLEKGVKKGPRLGALKRELYHLQLERNITQTKDLETLLGELL